MSKANTLERLLGSTPTNFVIDPFVAFTVLQWKIDSDDILSRVLRELSAETFIVRSSTVAEGEQGSSAGAYGSVSGVGRDRAALRCAISAVIATYTRDGRRSPPEDRVIVQSQVVQPRLAGVITTLDDHALPYLTISFDTSGRTDAVTRGERSTIVRLRRGASSPDEWKAVVAAAAQVCRLMSDPDLVIEFAQDHSNLVHIFQAWSRRRGPVASEADVLAREVQVSAAYAIQKQPIASTMSDWNPAEILGRQPGRLAISLYEELVTKSVWSEARAALGYFAPPGDLMFVLDGTPFINVEQSLRSLTPHDLPGRLRDEVVKSQLESVVANPALHDKIEWRVAMSCAALGDDPRLQPLREEVRSQLKTALASLTRRILLSPVLTNQTDEHIRAIRGARSDLARQHLTPGTLRRSLDTLKRHGTLPFAMHARVAFLLRDLVAQGVALGALPPGTIELCLRHTRTGAAALNTALGRVMNGTLTKGEFLVMFGHLRPEAYEVESPRYDSEGILEMMLQKTASHLSIAGTTPPSYPDADAFSALLASADLPVDGAPVLSALANQMEERERLKFSFTALLSDLLEKLASAGARRGLSRREVSSIPVVSLLEDRWEPVSSAWQLPMPDVLTPSLKLAFAEVGIEEPTFAGAGSFSGPPVVVNRGFLPSQSTDGSVVLMESAEPGCDWILSTGLGALATAYGGSASHMAIRAAELGIPMAVGCGVETLRRLSRATAVLIDADRKLLTAEF